jgi:hypothetical protein
MLPQYVALKQASRREKLKKPYPILNSCPFFISHLPYLNCCSVDLNKGEKPTHYSASVDEQIKKKEFNFAKIS